LLTLPQESGVNSDVLAVRDLRVYYHTPAGAVRAVDGVTFGVRPVERFGLVGESGSGKSTIALALMRLIKPPGRIEDGEIILDGTDLLALDEEQMRQMRLAVIALVTQGAMNSLNPVLRVRDQMFDALQDHGGKIAAQGFAARVADTLERVGLRRDVASMYPHELSGGMKQRVCIAIAISMRPKVIIADEPTSALDVVVQRVVAQTLMDVRERLHVSMILIGHDMGLQAQLVDRMAVMYAGNIVEIAPVQASFEEPLHPYTQLLIKAIPSIKERKPLNVTEGLTHDLRRPPPGCVFSLRCPQVVDHCRAVVPPLRELRPDQLVACHLAENWMK
jgi:peptide/nickel transport system ATP-binding protein